MKSTDAEMETNQTILVQRAKDIIIPNQLTFGGAKRMLDLIHRFSITKNLTTKQYKELEALIEKATI